jgi:hypothetical protein
VTLANLPHLLTKVKKEWNSTLTYIYFFFTSIFGEAIFILRDSRWPPSFSDLFFTISFFSLRARQFANCLCLQSKRFTNSCSGSCLSVALVPPQFLLLLSSSPSSSSSSSSMFISSYAFASCSFGRNLKQCRCRKAAFLHKIDLLSMRGPTENFQTRSLTVLYLV